MAVAKKIKVNLYKVKSQKHIFCSKECYKNNIGKFMSGENNHNYKRKEFICDTCSKKFLDKESARKGNRAFCSRECFMEANKNREKKALITVKCDTCQKDITIWKSRTKYTKNNYCSKECANKGFSKLYRGKNSPCYNHNLSDEERVNARHTPEYNDWRIAVYTRDNYTCQCCGDYSGGNLVAHHYSNYAQHEKLRYDVDNGATVCEKCHVSFHNEYGYTNNNKSQFLEFIARFEDVRLENEIKRKNNIKLNKSPRINKHLSYEEVKSFIEANSSSKLISTKYRRIRDLLDFKCSCGNIFKTSFDNFRKYDKYKVCEKCRPLPVGQTTYEDVKNFIENETDCKLISENYKSGRKIELICSCGEKFEANFIDFKNSKSKSCKKCRAKHQSKCRATSFEYVSDFVKNSNSGCELVSTEKDYINGSTKLIFKCGCGKEFKTTFNAFKNDNKRRCNQCSHQHVYNYSNVKKFIEFDSNSGCELISTEYLSLNQKLEIKCSCGSMFSASFKQFRDFNKRCCEICKDKYEYEYIKNI